MNEKLTDNEIIKALECCISDNVHCKECPLFNGGTPNCWEIIRENTLDLLNRKDEQINGLIAGQETLQKHLAEKNAEVERLHKEGLQLNRIFMDFVNMQKAEAIKGFAERLKKEADRDFWQVGCYVDVEDIDNLVKELTGPKAETSVSLIDGHIDGKVFWEDTN